MSDAVPDIVLLSEHIDTTTLRALVDRFFEDMVKYVVDVERGVPAVGGELHARTSTTSPFFHVRLSVHQLVGFRYRVAAFLAPGGDPSRRELLENNQRRVQGGVDPVEI